MFIHFGRRLLEFISEVETFLWIVMIFTIKCLRETNVDGWATNDLMKATIFLLKATRLAGRATKLKNNKKIGLFLVA